MCIIYNYRHRVIFESITIVRQVVYTHDYISIYIHVYIYINGNWITVAASHQSNQTLRFSCQISKLACRREGDIIILYIFSQF